MLILHFVTFLHFNFKFRIWGQVELMAEIKIILLGDSGVGKTCLANRFKTGVFKNSARETFVDVVRKTLQVKDEEVTVIVWDTGGHERYYNLVKRYFALAEGAVLMYDVNKKTTFLRLAKWVDDLRTTNEKVEIIIVGNQNEDLDQKQVDFSEVQNFAEGRNLHCMEASGKTGENVTEIFSHLIEKVLEAKGILSAAECEVENQIEDIHKRQVDFLEVQNSEESTSLAYTEENGNGKMSENEEEDCQLQRDTSQKQNVYLVAASELNSCNENSLGTTHMDNRRTTAHGWCKAKDVMNMSNFIQLTNLTLYFFVGLGITLSLLNYCYIN